MRLKTVEQLEKAVRKLDPNVKRPGLQAAVCLLAAASLGADEKRIVAHTAYPKKVVAEFSRNLRRSGIWTKDGKTVHSGWFDKKTGGISFWLDVCIALGLIERAKQ